MKTSDFDSYIEQSAPFAQAILSHLRTLVHQSIPGIEEEIKWQFPCFIYKKKILCNMAAFKEHCAFGFWLAPLMDDPYQVMENRGETSAMGQFGKIGSLTDLPPDSVLKEYLLEAATLVDQGKTLPKKTSAKKQYTMPESFKSALEKTPQALARFQRLSPSHQWEYLEYICEAKKEETRIRRVEKSIGKLLEGKDLNAQYK